MTQTQDISSRNKRHFEFAAIDTYTATATVSSEEIESRGKDYVLWGVKNDYPDYLRGLYNSSTTLQTIINGVVDFILGNDVSSTVPAMMDKVNADGDTIYDLVKLIAEDYLIYGGFAISVVRNRDGRVGELKYVDVSRLRSDKNNTVFYYSEEWSKSRVRTIKYPEFAPTDTNEVSIFYYKGTKTRGTYPVPIWNAATKDAEIDRLITDFHLNNINNGFAASFFVNFNNGVPEEDQQEEIERNIIEKFGGSANAGRIGISYNEDREHALTVERIESDDLDKKYELLRTWTREQLFTAFRAIPCLFGLMTENNGFSREEFSQAFELYSKTMVRPMQITICRALDKVLGVKDSVIIEPFKLEEV